MTTWPVWGVLILAVYSEANASIKSISDEIKEGQKNIAETAKATEKEVEEVARLMNRIFLEFLQVLNQSQTEGRELYKIYAEKVDKAVNTNFEKAIDLNESITALGRILEIKGNTEGELNKTLQTLKATVTTVLEKKKNELVNLKNLLDFTQKILTGIYEGLKDNMEKCKETDCITSLIKTAKMKQTSLTTTFKEYKKGMSNISDGLKEEWKNCLAFAEGEFKRVLRRFDHNIQNRLRRM